MLSETYDMGKFYEHGLYYWVKVRDETIHYPDENMVVGIYFGPAINVYMEMMAKIMEGNGNVLYCLT